MNNKFICLNVNFLTIVMVLTIITVLLFLLNQSYCTTNQYVCIEHVSKSVTCRSECVVSGSDCLDECVNNCGGTGITINYSYDRCSRLSSDPDDICYHVTPVSYINIRRENKCDCNVGLHQCYRHLLKEPPEWECDEDELTACETLQTAYEVGGGEYCVD